MFFNGVFQEALPLIDHSSVYLREHHWFVCKLFRLIPQNHLPYRLRNPSITSLNSGPICKCQLQLRWSFLWVWDSKRHKWGKYSTVTAVDNGKQPFYRSLENEHSVVYHKSSLNGEWWKISVVISAYVLQSTNFINICSLSQVYTLSTRL